MQFCHHTPKHILWIILIIKPLWIKVRTLFKISGTHSTTQETLQLQFIPKLTVRALTREWHALTWISCDGLAASWRNGMRFSTPKWDFRLTLIEFLSPLESDLSRIKRTSFQLICHLGSCRNVPWFPRKPPDTSPHRRSKCLTKTNGRRIWQYVFIVRLHDARLR